LELVEVAFVLRRSARLGPKARRPAEDEGDLDQFQAWLKGLKS